MKIPTLPFVLFSTLIFPAIGYSQENPWHPRYTASVSFNYSQIVDENIKPVSFTGPGGGVLLRRNFEGELFEHYIEAGGYAVWPKTSTENSTRSAMGNVSLKYGINAQHPLGSDHVGVGLFALGSMREAYYKDFGHNNVYWANFIGIGANLSLTEPLSEKYALQAIVDVPFLGLDYRPVHKQPYWKKTVSNMVHANFSHSDLATPGNYLNPSFTVHLLASKGPLRAISYRYAYLKAKTDVSGEYRENGHALMITFKIFK